MFKKEVLGKLLFVFGAATFLASLIDIASLLFPLHIANSEWVYSLVKSISEISIVSIMGIISMIGGFYLNMSKESKAVILVERISSGVCALFALFLIILTLLFSMSLSSVENAMAFNVKQKGENLKKQLIVYAQENPEITSKKINENIKNIDINVLIQVKSVNKMFLKANIKIFINILAYIVAYVLFSLILFKSSIITRKKLYYENNKPCQ